MKRSSCLFVLLAAPLTAQQTISFGDVSALPMLGSTSDHASVAINDRGDIFVAWSSATILQGTPTKQVEGYFIPRTSPTTWESPDPGSFGLHHFLLGEAGISPSGEIERCHKPDVVSVGDDFVVFFPRINRGSQSAVLEAVRIVIDPSLGTATLDSPAPGEGYLVDGPFHAGEGGVMPDGVRLRYQKQAPNKSRKGRAGVAYAEMTSGIPSARNFSLRIAAIDFSVSPPWVIGAGSAVKDIPVDFTGTYPGGGMLLPDIVEDDFGNLLVGWEEFESTARGVPMDDGRLMVAAFQFKEGAFNLVDSIKLQGVETEDRQRRPNLSSSIFDKKNTIGVAWQECEADGTDLRSHFGLLSLSSGQLQFQDTFFPGSPSREARRPFAILGKGIRACLAEDINLTGGSPPRMVAWSLPHGPALLEVPLAGWEAQRPACDLLEDPQLIGSFAILPISFEAAVTNSQGISHDYIFINIRKS
ncbi:MAG: hypothetical protein MK213_06880 [Planctomycetes bacterium]|nr:hypothetical protein [Planctomycetota bacterium]